MRLWKSAKQLLRGFHIRNIQTLISFSSIIVTVLTVVLVSTLLYNRFTRAAEKNVELSLEEIVEQVNSNLELYVSGMQDVFELTEHKIASTPEAASDERLGNELGTVLNTREDLVSIALFTEEGKLVRNVPEIPMRQNTRLQEQLWFESAMENPGKLQFTPPHIQNLFKWEYRWVVSMSKTVQYWDRNSLKQGVLVIDINFRTIDQLSQRVSLGKKGYAYIIDAVGNIVYHPQQQLIYAGLKYENLEPVLNYAYGRYFDESDGEQRIITIQTVKPAGWKIVGVAYADEFLTTKRELGVFLTWFLPAVIIIILAINIYVSARISQPIRRLERSVQMVERGDFGTIVHVSGAYEVEQLSKRFNLMLRRIRELMDQIIQEQEAKRKSELDVLQSQINPHFLYNTLNSATRLAELGRNEEVVTTITSLSRFFRISLSQGSHVISVQEELEHVRHYLIIQTIRFKNKFRYEIVADEAALECRTLKLILQPLVENAIHHGIEKSAEAGFIGVEARLEGEHLVFRIRDNGVGMPPETVEKLMKGAVRSESGSGVGVRNVQERIVLYYGPGYGLKFDSEPEEGTLATITIPAVKPENAQKDGVES
ncbi:MAG: sensor histidine kinase [Paenibacillus macerans]|uniref:histidine kinase n=2 Tax=Paenibacillus macerans TaxID=44252 RepID=A0A090YAC5_PAEMA|nr:sensor histidine kinase [Paenibacillus macerans]KFM95429.1 HAMP domain protein [Paenibacillus macerans]MCY7561382.1 sensor histidine kinase [Paenibacillus macerans]MDU7477202.1 sensor histidine kinase [Paenibacillus macerans]MEC0154418.1 sensor histidine kinase [Paenibacillus macerans]MEC0331004.1 sensor histidine kinase [Paenibacillus macerans]